MIYAIGDIHGEIDLLNSLYKEILNDISQHNHKENKIIFLGDYIDRGKGSFKVLDFMMNLKNTSNITHICLKGNHELMFRDAVTSSFIPYSQNEKYFWLNNGGDATVKETGWGNFESFIKHFEWAKYIKWIEEDAEFSHETSNFFFCHAGIDPRRSTKDQMPATLVWARHTQRDFYKDCKKTIVHGHTPTPDQQPYVDEKRICVDTSYHKTNKTKILTCVSLNEDGSIEKFMSVQRDL